MSLFVRGRTDEADLGLVVILLLDDVVLPVFVVPSESHFDEEPA